MAAIEIIDTHAHLDDPAFDSDRPEVVALAAASGVRRVVNVGYAPERWQTTRELAATYPHIAAMYGLHPQEADRFDDAVLADLWDTLRASDAVAVGEIGLDYFRNGPDRALQRRAFLAQIDLARKAGLPIVIHQRAAEADLIAILTSEADLPPVLLHSFDGTRALADLAVARGWMVGVGGLATKPSRQDLRDVLASVPLPQLVLETDAPYLAPAGSPSRRNEPAYVAGALGRLADIWHVSAEDLAAATTANAERFFALNPAGAETSTPAPAHS